MRSILRAGIIFLGSLAACQTAHAGMPSIGFTEVAAMRLQVTSFFLMGLLASAAVVRWLWNALSRDFPKLPRLSYAKACGIVVLWGLLFLVVLTMISGARELMTPGAWVKDGLTYKLRDNELSKQRDLSTRLGTLPLPATIDDRRLRLAALGELLRDYARANGKYPEDPTQIGTAANWELPDPSGIRYIYLPGRRIVESDVPLAYEPTVFDERPLVLMADGKIRQLSIEEIRTLVQKEQ